MIDLRFKRRQIQRIKRFTDKRIIAKFNPKMSVKEFKKLAG